MFLGFNKIMLSTFCYVCLRGNEPGSAYMSVSVLVCICYCISVYLCLYLYPYLHLYLNVYLYLIRIKTIILCVTL